MCSRLSAIGAHDAELEQDVAPEVVLDEIEERTPNSQSVYIGLGPSEALHRDAPRMPASFNPIIAIASAVFLFLEPMLQCLG